jgi:hypothetical protein
MNVAKKTVWGLQRKIQDEGEGSLTVHVAGEWVKSDVDVAVGSGDHASCCASFSELLECVLGTLSDVCERLGQYCTEKDMADSL